MYVCMHIYIYIYIYRGCFYVSMNNITFARARVRAASGRHRLEAPARWFF